MLLEDLEKKTAQLLAVMPNDSISINHSGCLSSASPLMCLNDSNSTSQLLSSVDGNKDILGGSYSTSSVVLSGQQNSSPSSQTETNQSSLDPNARAFNPLIGAN